MQDERPETVFSFTATNEYPTQEVGISFEATFLTDVLFEFNNFLRAAGFSYVDEVAAIYEDGAGVTSEGTEFDHLVDDEEESSE